MEDSKQVKVDNWGIYFLQRLKHFFNRTDYCDLTLQFQDNAQLKVHRLVLSACTEYFELLERTCEMYEDCLVMPDDLQADVVVPIINFMYTGQLEFKLDLLEKLYQTSLIMNMPVLTKLLNAHRTQMRQPPAKPAFQNSSNYYGKRYSKPLTIPIASNSSSTKRSFTTAFVDTVEPPRMKKPVISDGLSKADCIIKNGKTTSYQFPVFSEKNKRLAKDPRPTRYELPEELDEDNIFDNSFTNISYASKPLMVHPDSTKQYGSKRSINLFEEGTSSNRFIRTSSTNDIVECRKITMNDNIFVDDMGDNMQECNFQQSPPMKDESKDTSQLFDQILDNNASKITIEAKNNTQTNNMDHAKIISEVLKKYPQLVKSNRNIKLKILNTSKTKKSQPNINSTNEEKVKPKHETPDFTYESDVINSKEAARLIALGAENIAGPWICLICGTPGKALHFTSYFNFRKHLVEVHNEKPVPTICEYCGIKSQKRNYLVYHKLTKHGVPAPTHYNFPKCNYCSYTALTEALMVKHKASHTDKYKFNMPTLIPSSQVAPTQKASQKYPSPAMSTERQKNQCTYCTRVFLREHNLYAHLKTNHKEQAKNDGIIDDSEEEQEDEDKYASKLKSNNDDSSNFIKLEVPATFDNSFEDVNDQYQIEQKPDGSIYVVSKKPRVMLPLNKNKILNLGFTTPHQNVPQHTQSQKTDTTQNIPYKKNEFSQNAYVASARHIANEEIVIIDNNEYILRNNQLILKKEKNVGQYIPTTNASSNTEVTIQTMMPTTSMEYHNNLNTNSEPKMLVKKSSRVNQPLQIVVSNEEEYKALMNTNQSVIYDERETNKALAVLTAESTSLESGTIDLDNNQSNDMMIIPNEFPMNIPETVSSDNSNIVVVYSHPLEDQSKQYSLIATQGIEGEFIQSSTILTQNYETVTTCTPVMSAHTSMENSWQNNIHSNINKLSLAPSSELQTMTVGESITIAPIESNSLSALSAVHLTTTESVPMQVAQNNTSENTFNQPNIITEIHQPNNDESVSQQNTIITVTESRPQGTIVTVTEASVLNNIEQQTISHMQPISVTNLVETNMINTFDQKTPVNTSTKPIITNTIDPSTSCSEKLNPGILGTVQVEEILQDENSDTSTKTNIAQNNIIESNACSESTNMDTNVQSSDTAHHLTDNNFMSSSIQHPTVAENNLKQEPVMEIKTNKTIDDSAIDITDNKNSNNINETSSINHGSVNISLTNMTTDQIKCLTSEWSEDESDNLVLQNDMSKDKNDDCEETIENIQREIEQQVSNEIQHDNEDSVTSSQDDNLSTVKSQTNASQNMDNVSQEKISSLLNDWDDNDSQEEETSAVDDDEVNGPSLNSSAQNEEIITINKSESEGNHEIKKNENIKSLVSDWDEEDDENKD